jgi:hypothetical protein
LKARAALFCAMALVGLVISLVVVASRADQAVGGDDITVNSMSHETISAEDLAEELLGGQVVPAGQPASGSAAGSSVDIYEVELLHRLLPVGGRLPAGPWRAVLRRRGDRH